MPASDDVGLILCSRCGPSVLPSTLCPECGQPSAEALVAQLRNVDDAMDALAARRTLMVAQLAACTPDHQHPEHVVPTSPHEGPGHPGHPGQARAADASHRAPLPHAPPSPASSWLSRLSPQQLLLSAGAVLVLLACLFFAAQAFHTLGLAGQGAVLVGTALTATGGARAAHERALPVTRAALALLGSGVAITAMAAPRLVGLPAAAHLDGAHYVALVASGGALFAMCSAAVTRERLVGLVAVALLSTLAPALAIGGHASGAAFGAMLLVSAAAGMVGLSLYTAPRRHEHRPAAGRTSETHLAADGRAARSDSAELPLRAVDLQQRPGGRTGWGLRAAIVLQWMFGLLLAGPYLLTRLIRGAGGPASQQACLGAAIVATAGLFLVAVSLTAQKDTGRSAVAGLALRALPVAPIRSLQVGISVLGFAAAAPLLERSPVLGAVWAALSALAFCAFVRAQTLRCSDAQQHLLGGAAAGGAITWTLLLIDSCVGPHAANQGARTAVLLSGVLASALLAASRPAFFKRAGIMAEVMTALTLISAAQWQHAPASRTAAAVMALGALLVIGSSLRRSRLYAVLDVGGYITLGLGTVLTLHAHTRPYLAMVALLGAGLACAASSVRPDRRIALVPASAFLTAATAEGLSLSGAHLLEPYTGAGAALILAITALAAVGPALEVASRPPAAGALQSVVQEGRWQDRFARTWSALPSQVAYGPALGMLFLPSLLKGLTDDRFTRLGWVTAGAVVTLLVGVHRRLSFPQLIGGAVLIVVALAQLSPLVASAPRFLVFGGLGLLVLVVGVTYERRLADVKKLRFYFAQLH